MAMARKIDGRRAEITSPGRRFSTYREFARNHGYPDAAAESDWSDNRQTPQEGDIVTLLTSGPHLTMYMGDTLWVVEAANGERHIFNEKGLRILDEVKREYTEVKRKARVGERIKIVGLDHGSSGGYYYRLGNVATVRRVYDSGNIDADFSGNDYVLEDGKWCVGLRDYIVLEPVTPAQPSIAELVAITDGLTDAVAKLTRKVAELETRVKVTEEDVVLIESGVADEISALKKSAAPKPLTRDDVIERAKTDVAELQKKNHDDVLALTGCRVGFYVGWDEVKFVINRDKRTVVALLKDTGVSRAWARGIAKAAPGDVFNTHIGRAIALRRALGLEVPAEYTNAPQPSEPRVGDIVEYEGYRVVLGPDGKAYNYTNGSAAVSSYVAKNGNLIDDSREEVAA